MKKRIPVMHLVMFLLALCVLQSTNGSFYKPGMLHMEKGLRAPLSPPDQQGVEPGYWKVEADILLHYFTSGEGIPILVIHGGPGFPPQKPWRGLEIIKEEVQALYYHQRGCGLSTKPIDTFETQNFMKNVVELNKALGLSAQLADMERIRRILKLDKLNLIGHSYGGFMAALYALEFPQHVNKMVLIAPAEVLKMPNDEGGFANYRKYLPEDKKTAFDQFLTRYFNYGQIFAKSEKDLIALNEEFGQFYMATYTERNLPYPAAEALDIEKTGGWMPHAIYFSLGMKYDLREELKKVPVEVLVIHGENDMMPIAASQEYAELFPKGNLKVIKGATHFPHSETPQEFASLIKTYFFPD